VCTSPISATDNSRPQFTQHALLLAWGEFVSEIGLIQKFRQVPMAQKSIVHLPQARALSFLLGILSGITHLRDLNEGPHPLTHDKPVLRAWSLTSLAHYNSISRAAASGDEATVAAITQILNEISQPFIDREVKLLLANRRSLLRLAASYSLR
jgi:hypothetical protein